MSEWQKVKIGDLLKRYKNSVNIQDSVKYKRVTIRGKHQGISIRDEEVGKKIGTKKQFTIKAGQFLLSKIDARYGAFGAVSDELDGAIITGNFWAYDVNKTLIDVDFFNQFTNSSSFYDLCERSSSGITHRKYLDEKKFLNFELSIPDINTQKEIVQKNTALRKKDNLLLNQNTFQQYHLNLLRQQILQDAISGKLTAYWRAENPDIEPASELLEQIKVEKEKLIAGKKIKKEKPLPKITEDEVPFELPKKWEWCRLGDVCFKITDGFHNTPPKVKDGFPYIAATHVKSEKIDWENCHYVEEKFHRELWNKTFPKKGEVLVVNIGAGSGTPAIIDVEYEFSFKNTAILKFFQDKLNNEYLFSFFMSSRASIYAELTKGGLQPFLSLKILNNIIFQLPPLAEQKAIVAKVEKLMDQVAQLEEKIKQNKQDDEMLMQSFLVEAFKN